MITRPGPSCADIAAACCLHEPRRFFFSEMRNHNIGCSFGKQTTFVSLFVGFWGSNTRDLFAGEKEVLQPPTDEQQERKSLRTDSQRIHQQSNERTRGWSRTGLSRVPEKLDHSFDSKELWLRYSSHQYRVRSEAEARQLVGL